MTELPPEPARAPAPREPDRLDPAKLAAASLGSVLAALLASRFGTTGTIVGAAIAPVFVMVAVEALAPRLQRGIAALSGRRDWRWALRHPREFVTRVRGLSRPQLALALGAATLAFAGGMLVLTVIEKIAGEPVSGIARGGPNGGTTLAPKHRGDELTPPENQNPEAEPGTGGTTATETVPTETETQPPSRAETETQPPTNTTTTPTEPPSDGLGSETVPTQP